MERNVRLFAELFLCKGEFDSGLHSSRSGHQYLISLFFAQYETSLSFDGRPVDVPVIEMKVGRVDEDESDTSVVIVQRIDSPASSNISRASSAILSDRA